jgi:hypothetical protein
MVNKFMIVVDKGLIRSCSSNVVVEQSVASFGHRSEFFVSEAV